ncbi:hypothetical protein FRB91_009662 [Serendipita sp. 411]|nr:hypothetical protein FRC19_006766 [Serendipita sp. 401]KAG8831890.1 hypothetical protein FRC18_005810 [Serendipita sp. 400]KAG8849731.1 hypothetical protein FRB91_009662 [Serendipita sp. 411]KAG9057597.1 hypothetical protein FS842_005558 [Serendipita sp. 407]
MSGVLILALRSIATTCYAVGDALSEDTAPERKIDPKFSQARAGFARDEINDIQAFTRPWSKSWSRPGETAAYKCHGSSRSGEEASREYTETGSRNAKSAGRKT